MENALISLPCYRITDTESLSAIYLLSLLLRILSSEGGDLVLGVPLDL